MIPHLVKSDEASRSAGPEAPSLIPPLHFRPLKGPISNVRIRLADYASHGGLTASQKNGLRYEREAQEFFQKKFEDRYCPSPWLHFEDNGVARTVQPDGLLFTPSRVFIFEMKYQHMPEAWWQLQRLYYPLVCRVYPTMEVHCIEVCRSYDPATPFPVLVPLISDLDKWLQEPRDFGVFKWRG